MLEMRRGDSAFFAFQRKDFDENPILKIAEKVWFTIKDNANSKKTLVQKTLDDGIYYTDDGYYHIVLKPSDTKALKYKKYYYDVQIENVGIVNTIAYDKIKINPEITYEGGE